MKTKTIGIIIILFIVFSIYIYKTVNNNQAIVKTKEGAITVLKQKTKEAKVSSYWATSSCVFYIADEIDKNTYQIRLHEKHTIGCPGDPNTSPLLAQFRLNKKTGGITWYDITSDRYISFEEFVRNSSKDDITKVRTSQEITFDKYWRNNSLKIIIAKGKGCISCHQNWIYVFDDKGKIVFQTDTSDAVIGEITNDSFQIKETPSGSTESHIRTFYWSDNKIIERN